MEPDPILPANVNKRLEHQAELEGLSLAEMVEKLVAEMEEEENGLDGRAIGSTRSDIGKITMRALQPRITVAAWNSGCQLNKLYCLLRKRQESKCNSVPLDFVTGPH